MSERATQRRGPGGSEQRLGSCVAEVGDQNKGGCGEGEGSGSGGHSVCTAISMELPRPQGSDGIVSHFCGIWRIQAPLRCEQLRLAWALHRRFVFSRAFATIQIDFYFFPQISLSSGVSEGIKESVLVFLQSIPQCVNKFLLGIWLCW